MLRKTIEPLIREKGIRATARQLGVHHALLVDWLNGHRSIPLDTFERLTQILNLTIELKPHVQEIESRFRR